MPAKVVDTAKKIVKSHKKDPGNLIGILQDIQAKYRYLPREALDEVSKSLNVPMNRLYAVSTFYKAFYLEPRGKHDCVVCTGNACHVSGAGRVMDELTRLWGVEPGGTSKDGLFSLETTSCVGACALAPVLTIDGDIHGKVTARSARRVIKKYEDPEEKKKNETKKRRRSGKAKAKSTRKKRSG